MKTFSAKAQDVERKWYVIDAQNKVLGQVAVEAANLLRGKNKTIFTPHVDTGDFVIITNAEKVVLSGNKEGEKIYTRYTGYVGNQEAKGCLGRLGCRRPETEDAAAAAHRGGRRGAAHGEGAGEGA